MEQKPYTLCSTDGTGRRYLVLRRDESWARYICLNAAGLWKIEGDHFSPAVPAFPSQDTAARFASMEGRFYCHTVPTRFSERVQVRVMPNFGEYWHTRPLGKWVVSLHKGDGTFATAAGNGVPFDELAKGMAAGLQGALHDPAVTNGDALGRDWEEIGLRDLPTTDPFRRATRL